MTKYIFAFATLFILEIIYFKIADRFNIIDKPNHRSSHTAVTIRGGGVIFAIAALGWFLFNQFQYPYFIVGLMAISFISFLDDVVTLNNKWRLAVHLIAVILLFMQWQLFNLSWYWLIIALVFVVATINAYNFMDGINGLTGSYSLLTLGTLYYINSNVVNFISADLLIVIGLSSIVFNFFNFRKSAKCFAGDVGSVAMAFIIIFLIGQLILVTNNFAYILLLLVYGIDTAFTVFFRKLRSENIFEAHRTHFYQYLSNYLKYSHLFVSLLYFSAQLLINVLIILLLNYDLAYTIVLFAAVVLIYLTLRLRTEGRKKLLTFYE